MIFKKPFKKKVSVITGAASGIGRALAVEMARRGSALAISDVDEAGLKETADAARELGVDVLAERLDVADREAFEAHAARVLDHHGRADIIVNNAGVALTQTVADMSYEDLEWIMNVDFWGVVHGTMSFLPHLIERGSGHIINISSVFGIIGVPTQSAYNAAKFAVRGFSESLRQEMAIAGNKVHVAVVHPGGIKTNIVRNARVRKNGDGTASATVDEAADAFERLARTTPKKAAEVIINGIRKRKPRILIGADAHLIDAIQRRMPEGYDRLVIAASKRSGV